MSHKKVVTGIISITPGDNNFFPEEHWNDSIILVLNSWIENIISILREGYNEVQFVFFDGPFSFIVNKEGIQSTIKFFQGSRQIEKHNMDFYEFGNNVIKLGQEALREVKERGWEANDMKGLELSLKKILPYFDLKDKQNR